MQKILFLDFDGVLNSAPTRSMGEDAWEKICPWHVEQLNQVVARTGCKVVVSSTWRHSNSLDELRDILYKAGFEGEVIGMTPMNLPCHFSQCISRGAEIQTWLDENNINDAVIAIVDDCEFMDHLEPRLVKTDDRVGLMPEHVDELVALLNGWTTKSGVWANGGMAGRW